MKLEWIGVFLISSSFALAKESRERNIKETRVIFTDAQALPVIVPFFKKNVHGNGIQDNGKPKSVQIDLKKRAGVVSGGRGE